MIIRTGVRGALPAWLLLVFSLPASAGIDTAVESAIAPLAAALSSVVFYRLPLFGYEVPWIVLWLAVAASFFTLYLGFINIRGFGLALRLVRGDYHDPAAPGEISHFQAVATAVSGTAALNAPTCENRSVCSKAKLSACCPPIERPAKALPERSFFTE